MANVNYQPPNAVTQLNWAFRISLQPQHPIDIRADETCDSFNTPQKPLLSGNYTVIDIGVFSRQGIFAWVRGIIHELQSYNLHTVNLVPALWGQLFKIIQNHSSFKRWIFSRPRPGPMGFLTSVHDPSEELHYTAENVLGRARIIWQGIEADLVDEEPNQFVGEIFRQVYHIWQYKCYMNNMLRDLRGHPRTTDRDGFLELMRYRLPRQIPAHPNHPAPVIPTLVPAATLQPALQPARPPQNPVGANTGIVGHASIIGNPDNNPTRRVGNTLTGARKSTGMSVAAGSLVISDSQSSGQSDNSNPAFNQPYAPVPTADPDAGRIISTLMVSTPAFAHGLRRANPIVSSAMPNVVQAGGSKVPATSGPQNNGNRQNGNAQGNRQPLPGPGAAMGQTRPPQPNLRRRRSSTRTQHPQHVRVFNSSNSDSSTAGLAVTQKRPANTNSNASSLAGPSRLSGKKIKMENPDTDH
ncbi:hypothetical protein BHYA_0135g00250 [Botrytis hyacinthi]|uniref:Uncharacterized protein n=1 Tax=Botrytis hyacinthi TaxID=278943 RepID=A0A4Z1GLF2_9HELO|nr:hypothetical protein BHYA_0135g00250 [Botrytis hyacinthi]